MTTRHSDMTARAMRQVLDVVDPAAHTGDGEYVPWSMLHALAAVIGCDEASFQVMNPWRRQVSVQAITEEADVVRAAAHPPTPAAAAAALAGEEDHMALFWRGFWASAAATPNARATTPPSRGCRISTRHENSQRPTSAPSWPRPAPSTKSCFPYHRTVSRIGASCSSAAPARISPIETCSC